MSEWLNAISTIGVPAAIAFFVLWRLDKNLSSLKESIDRLIEKLNEGA